MGTAIKEVSSSGQSSFGGSLNRVIDQTRMNLILGYLAGLSGSGLYQRRSAGLQLSRTTCGHKNIAVFAVKTFHLHVIFPRQTWVGSENDSSTSLSFRAVK